MAENVLVTRGRYQPFGNHHAAVIDYFADKNDADSVYVLVDDTHGSRLPTSPAMGEEVVEMVEEAYETYYDADFEVTALEHDGLNPFSYREPLKVLRQNPTFFTREEEWAEPARKASSVLSFMGVDLEVDYEPRSDQTPFEEFPEPVETSSTAIRQGILQDGDEWRNYVSDPVERFIDSNKDFHEVLEPEEEQNHSKHFSLIRSKIL